MEGQTNGVEGHTRVEVVYKGCVKGITGMFKGTLGTEKGHVGVCREFTRG